MRRRVVLLLAGALIAAPLPLVAAQKGAGEIPPAWRAAVERITAASMRGHLSFLASDLLEGRDTPSRGQDVAAEYLAAQFRRAGLEPGGNEAYFQSFEAKVQEPNFEGVEFSITIGGTTMRIAQGAAIPTEGPIDLKDAQAVRIGAADAVENLEGKVALVVLPDAARQAMTRIGAVARAKPLLSVVADPTGALARQFGRTRIVDPSRPGPAIPPLYIVSDPAFADAVAKIEAGAAVTVTAKAKARIERTVKLRNVVAVLRGSDPKLRDTAVVLSAHYDHIGALPPGEGDRIYNGANDDGSGTVGVVEIASALAALPSAPKRSIVFVAFCGEERGGHGSRYYGRNAPFSPDKTVANLNLEQIGRSDSSEGEQRGNYSITGFDYSNVADFLSEAAKAAGVAVYKHERNSDAYFTRSDNAVLARLGVPAHSLTTAFQYPDYHGLGDHWDKIDYGNMEKISRAIALGLLSIADSETEPAWSQTNPRAEPFRRMRPVKQ